MASERKAVNVVDLQAVYPVWYIYRVYHTGSPVSKKSKFLTADPCPNQGFDFREHRGFVQVLIGWMCGDVIVTCESVKVVAWIHGKVHSGQVLIC